MSEEMTREEAIKMAKADLRCMERDVSGQDEMCNGHKCDECSLNYERGNMGEQKEWLRMAIKALEQTRWIPVSKRLPERNMACLVAVGKFNLTQMAMYSDLMGTIDHRIFYQGDFGDDNFENITQYVNAWMPLPQHYDPQESKD